ncbi:MAG TPA: hypothetical protein VN178_08760 [Rubrobacter sp.]|jgi:hypothetical protein|nr:hypothetical protein [Rubrobacter sp.]
METHPIQVTPKYKAYRIVVRAEIGERFAAAFEGMEVRIAEGRTIITGEVIDQSHLHGILDRINALGLVLVSVQPESEEPPGGSPASHWRRTGPAEERTILEDRYKRKGDR